MEGTYEGGVDVEISPVAISSVLTPALVIAPHQSFKTIKRGEVDYDLLIIWIVLASYEVFELTFEVRDCRSALDESMVSQHLTTFISL
jgi:hypothetical protein